MIRRTFILSSAALLTGCSILPERPPLKYYGLDVGEPPLSCIAKRRLKTSIRVNLPRVATPYNSPKIYIKGKDNRFFVTDINRLMAPPNDLIGDALRAWLEKTGPWNTVISPNSLATPVYQLTVYVSDLFADTSSYPKEDFKISMEVSVIRSSDDKLMFHKNYTTITPIKAETMDAVVGSYCKGLSEVFVQISTDLNHTFIKN